MTKRKFDALVKKAVKHGNIYRAAIDELIKFSKEKYNHTWNELDCDSIIDALEFGCGYLVPISFEEFKQEIEAKTN